MSVYPRSIVLHPGILVYVKDKAEHDMYLRYQKYTLISALIFGVALFVFLITWF